MANLIIRSSRKSAVFSVHSHTFFHFHLRSIYKLRIFMKKHPEILTSCQLLYHIQWKTILDFTEQFM